VDMIHGRDESPTFVGATEFGTNRVVFRQGIRPR